jgi:F420-dependent oxidoreductase-like protein
MRIGTGVDTSGDLADVLGRIKAAEDEGFAGIWIPNIFGYDAITLLALAGAVTSKIELGTFVVPTYPRHPTAIAQQALTAAAATGGRFTLGIGLSHKLVIEDMFGLDYSKPVRHTREYLSVLMPMLRQEGVRFAGDEYRVNAKLDLPGVSTPTVIVAALGPQLLKVAGRLADGTATWMGGVKYLKDVAIPTISAAAAEAGRPAPRIVSGFPVAVTTNVEAARTSAAHAFAMSPVLPRGPRHGRRRRPRRRRHRRRRGERPPPGPRTR